MKRRQFLFTGVAGIAALPAIGFAYYDPDEVIGSPILNITNIIPESRIAVIAYDEVVIEGIVKTSEWVCAPPINTPLTIRIRKALTPPYYKSLELYDVYVEKTGMNLVVQQISDE